MPGLSRIASSRLTAAAGVAACLITALTLSACGGGSASAGPTWVPQPGVTLEPNPVNPGSGPASTGAPSDPASPSPSAGAPSTGATPAPDPAIVATGLSAPIGIAVLPDGTALVGERSGVIVDVQPTPGQPATVVRTITGLDATGDGGLLDLALSPAYAQDHLIYAYVTTPTDNRVVDFSLTGPMTPVFTGIPKGATGNGGRIAFGVDGSLFIATGDAGQPALAQVPTSLAGKVLEVSDIGKPVTPGAPILARGLHSTAGLCVDPDTASVFETEPGAVAAAAGGSAAAVDEVNLVVNGADFGWPTAALNSQAALATETTLVGFAGCAVADDVVYVASLDGTSLYSAPVLHTASSVKLDPFSATLTGQYGRLITVVADPDGSLWIATSNKAVTGPAPKGAAADDDRILHIHPSGGGAGSTL